MSIQVRDANGTIVTIATVNDLLAIVATHAGQIDLDANGNGKVVNYDVNGDPLDEGAAVPVFPGIPGTPWYFNSGSGGHGTTTSAATVVAAAGASIRNYMTSLSISGDSVTNATEIVVRDGAGGTVLWRGYMTTAGYPAGRHINFSTPLRSTANTLLEIATLTAVGSGKTLYINAQGYSA